MHSETSGRTQTYTPIFSMGQLSFGYYGIVLHIAWLFLLFYSPGIGAMPFPHAEYISPSYLASVASLVLMLGVIALAPKTTIDFFDTRPWCYVVPSGMAAGTLLCILYYSDFGFWWGIVGGIVTGIASAIMAVRWVHEYGKLDLDDLFVNLPMIATSSIVLCFSLLFFPLAIILAFLALSPLVSGWSLMYVQRIAQVRPCESAPFATRNSFAYACILVTIGLVGFASGFLDFTAQGTEGASYSSVFYVLIAVVLFAAAGAYIKAHRRSLFSSAFVLPLCILVVVLIPYLHVFVANPSTVFIALGEISFEALLMLLSAAYAFYFGVSAVRVFCLGRIAMALFDLTGWFLAMNLHQTALSESGPQFMLLCAFLGIEMVCVIVFAALLLGRTHQSSLDDSVLTEVGKETRQPDQEYGDMLRQRCLQMQDEFSLSARELDVLMLLARGYSATAIQEHLHIAAGTVNSHTRNIYRKLDVHSKSQIIDIVENWK